MPSPSGQDDEKRPKSYLPERFKSNLYQDYLSNCERSLTAPLEADVVNAA